MQKLIAGVTSTDVYIFKFYPSMDVSIIYIKEEFSYMYMCAVLSVVYISWL